MKLIDLLVQELPKRGGWPEGAVECQRFVDEATIDFYDENGNWDDDCSLTYSSIAVELVRKPAYPCESEQVTRDQYKSALAALNKPAWNGEGLPPVGCECECHVDEGIIHCVVVGYDFDGKAVVMRNVPARKYFSIQANSGRIKPLRSEAEKKRDIAVKVIKGLLMFDYGDDPRVNDATFIYDAIAAGKIPGVKLDD